MSDGLASAARLDLVERIESHCVATWPALFVKHTPDGWVLRATPGLSGRGRSNHALVPARALGAPEIERGIAAELEFASRHGVECGLQVGPLEGHGLLLEKLATRGWHAKPPVLVMTASVSALAADSDPDPEFALELTDHVTPEWFSAWRLCDPQRKNAAGHIDTVFRLMAGAARFGRFGNHAVGIVAERGGLAALYCLAVHPDFRRQGLGTRLVRGLLADSPARMVYLQVFSLNEAGRGLYNSLGFSEAYRYCHCVGPTGVA